MKELLLRMAKPSRRIALVLGLLLMLTTNGLLLAAGELSADYSISPPTSWTPGQTQTYSVTVTNNGSQVWNSTGDKPVKLGIHFGTASDAWHDGWATDLRIDLPNNVAPGESVNIPVNVTAPANAGAYVLRHRMVKENWSWFEQIHKTNITVANP